jgi:hypothetical protein
MRFVKTKLFVTLMGVVCLSLVGGYLGITLLSTAPIHAAASRNSTIHLLSSASGGGCSSNTDQTIAACISIDGNGKLQPDAYLSGKCRYSEIMLMMRKDNGSSVSVTTSRSTSCNHVSGTSASFVPGKRYYTHVWACFDAQGCGPGGGPEEQQDSPDQRT